MTHSCPVLLGPGTGEAVTDSDDREVHVLATRTRTASTPSRHPTTAAVRLADAVVREAHEGEELAMGATRLRIKAGREDGIGSLALTQVHAAPGFPGPVPHRHRAMVDSFYVVDGTLTLRVGQQSHAVGPGTFALIPPGVVHTFSNPGVEPVRLLNLMAPAGLEAYLRETAAATRPGEAPDPARMAQLASRYDFEPVG